MVEDFQLGTRGQAMADARAEELANSIFGENNRAQGHWPLNIAEENVPNNFYELYHDVSKGPLYGYYTDGNSGHYVVITGANLWTQEIYTNNPWGISGVQTYEEFLLGFSGGDNTMPFKSYMLIN